MSTQLLLNLIQRVHSKNVFSVLTYNNFHIRDESQELSILHLSLSVNMMLYILLIGILINYLVNKYKTQDSVFLFQKIQEDSSGCFCQTELA